MNDYKFHPAALLFPPLQGDALAAFAANIKAYGLREPIIRTPDPDVEGGWLIVDGRNRLAGCDLAGVEPHFAPLPEGTDPLAFALSANLHRRHLGQSQRGLLAARLSNMRQGERTDLEPSANLRKVSQAEAAKLVNVSTRLVTAAVRVLKKASPELIAKIDKGELTIGDVTATWDAEARAAKHKADTGKLGRDANGVPLAEKAAEATDSQDEGQGPSPADEDADAAGDTIEPRDEVPDPIDAGDGGKDPDALRANADAGTDSKAQGIAPEKGKHKSKQAGGKAKVTTGSNVKTEPKLTAKQREEENRKLAFKMEGEAREARQARESGDKALAIIAAHMPGDAIEALYPLLQDAACGGGSLHFLAGLAKLKSSHQGNGGENKDAEIVRLTRQVALLQGDVDGIAIDPKSSAGNIADQLRAALGDKKADALGEVLLGRLDREFPPDQEAAE